jgi:hypothetical protein
MSSNRQGKFRNEFACHFGFSNKSFAKEKFLVRLRKLICPVCKAGLYFYKITRGEKCHKYQNDI